MNLALTLDDEIKRVAKAEGITREELVDEVSRLAGCGIRQIYNYRSDKWALPAKLIPVLCKRFRSQALLYALVQECEGLQVEVPDNYDLVRLVAQAIRTDMQHYDQYLQAFDSNGIDANELATLRATSERIIVNLRHLDAIAGADYERRHQLKSAQ